MGYAGTDIVIVNWNSGDLLRQCLESLATLRVDDRYLVEKLIIVDNASRDDSMARLPPLPFPVTMLMNARNVGFAAACNQGSNAGVAPYVLFLNPDMRLLPDSLLPPLALMEQSQDIGICGIQLVDNTGEVARSCSRFIRLRHVVAKLSGLASLVPRSNFTMMEWDHAESRDVDQVMGAFFLVRRELFEALDGFDPRFFVYYEDMDFSLRARLAGWRSYYLASARAFHEGGGASRQIKAERLNYALSSRLLYGFKHFHRTAAIAHLALTLAVEPWSRLFYAAIRGSWREAGDTLRGYSLLWRNMPGLLRNPGGRT